MKKYRNALNEKFGNSKKIYTKKEKEEKKEKEKEKEKKKSKNKEKSNKKDSVVDMIDVEDLKEKMINKGGGSSGDDDINPKKKKKKLKFIGFVENRVKRYIIGQDRPVCIS